MIDVCDSCLRRAFLVARLAPRIAGLLQRPRPRPQSLLALSEEQLIAAVVGVPDPGIQDWLESFDRIRFRTYRASSAGSWLHRAVGRCWTWAAR